MLVLRRMGLPLPQCRAAALKAAPSVLFIALANHPGLLAVDAAPEEAKRYIGDLERRMGDRYLRLIAGVGEDEPHVVLIQGERYLLLSNLQNPRATDLSVEASALRSPPDFRYSWIETGVRSAPWVPRLPLNQAGPALSPPHHPTLMLSELSV